MRRAASSSQMGAQDARILVVEDDAAVRDVIALTLEDEGYRVAQAGDGQEALEKLQQEPPDAIVTDLMMPRLSGWDFVRICHEQGLCNGVPILVISAAHDLRNSAEELRPLGVVGVVAKPFDVEVLVGAVERLLRT